MGQIIFIIVFMIVIAILVNLIMEWADNDIDVLFVWNRNVLCVGFVVAFIIWAIKVMKVGGLFEVDFSALALILIFIQLLINFLTSKIFHRRFSPEQRRQYLMDPRIPVYANRLPFASVLTIFGVPVFLIYDIWYLISSYFL